MKLRELMAERKMTDADLAMKLGCRQSTVHSWKSDKYMPNGKHLRQICEIFQVSADELLGIEIEKPPKIGRALAVDLLESITKRGSYNSQYLHQMATMYSRKFHGGRISGFEMWLRGIAEAVYKCELTLKNKSNAETDKSIQQMRLF